MKYDQTHSLRTQQAIAQFGKCARHPVCLAALDFWRLDAEVLAHTKAVASVEELLNDVKQNREEAQTLIEQFRRERREKEAIEVSSNLRKFDKLLRKVQSSYEATVKLRSIFQKLRGIAFARFEGECDTVTRTGGRRGTSRTATTAKAMDRQ